MHPVVRPRLPAVSNGGEHATTSQKNAGGGLIARVVERDAIAAPRRGYVRVAIENRLLHGGLLRALMGSADIELAGIDPDEILFLGSVQRAGTDLLILASRGNLAEDIAIIRKVRTAASSVRILIIMSSSGSEPSEFLQCVRAGVRGYLLPDASPADILNAVIAVHGGSAVCPSSLCGVLFNYFERQGTSSPSGLVRQRLGLTRREQQLIPLIAQGLTNKEIANRLCLSEQTVKNHLYRMKHKVGAENRLGIVETCHMNGFLL